MTEAQTVAPIAASNLAADALRDITSLEDAVALLNASGLEVRHVSDEMGDGFSLLDDKDALVGTPFIILSSSLSAGDFGAQMVTVRLVTRDGRKIIINDGGTGIRAQAEDYASAHDGASLAGLMVEKGLRASRFKFCGDCKKVSKLNAAECATCGNSDAKTFTPAATYYFDTSAAS